jgi:hypothetical protein
MALIGVGMLAWNRESQSETASSRRIVWQQQPQQTQPPQVIILQAPSPPAEAQPTQPSAIPSTTEAQQVLRIELPQERSQAQQQEAPRRSEIEERAAETQWRMQRGQLEARLQSSFAEFKQAVCQEGTGGVPLVTGSKTYADYRNEYVSAKFQAAAFVESARRGGIPSDWVDINMRGYPEPPPPGTTIINLNRSEWGCVL